MGQLSRAAFGSVPDLTVPVASGVEVAVYRRPGGSPCVFLAHATGFCAGVWRPVVDALDRPGRTWTVTAWDARNHGASGRAPHPISWWDVAADAARVVEAMPRRGPVIGVGHSMGGATLLMAQAGHALFDVLVLIEPILPGPPIGRVDHPLVGLARRRRREFPTRADARANFASKPPFSTWDPGALDGYVDGGIIEEEGGARLACLPEDEAEVFLGASAHGMVERLGEVEIPVLLLVGSDTDTYPVSWAAELARKLPAGHLDVIEGGTHFLPMERPELVARRIAAAGGLGRAVS